MRRRQDSQNYRLRKLGVSDKFHKLSQQQRDRCAICKIEQELVVDHCHTTNAFRGLLCRQCNYGLGMFKDDPERLRNAIAYLANPNRVPTEQVHIRERRWITQKGVQKSTWIAVIGKGQNRQQRTCADKEEALAFIRYYSPLFR